jgi:hypothetical protein
MDIIPRIGTFFYIVGWGLMILFIASEFSREANFNYFFLSLLTLFLGHQFRRRAERHESGRFGSIRRARERSRLKRDEKYKKDNEKK